MPSFLRAAGLLIASSVVPGFAAVDALNATISEDGVTVWRDIVYADGPRGSMDVYRPDRTAGKLPLVVFFYGGAWHSGAKEIYKFVAAPLAREGVVVAVPDYRLVPQVRFPAFLEDNAKAVSFARALAAEWGADPARVFLVGHSAGAYNALMLALDPHYLAAEDVDRADLSGVIGIAGPADFSPSTNQATIAAFGQAPDPRLTQPMTFVDGANPPLLLLHGDSDGTVLPSNSTSLASRIDAAGGHAAVKMYRGIGHVGIITSFAPIFDGRAPTLADTVAFIRSHSAVSVAGL